MENTIELKNPIMINGDEVKTLSYDFDKIDGLLFAQVETKRKADAGTENAAITYVAEADPGFQLYMGYAAIIADNRSYDIEDLKRAKGHDIIQIMNIGRNFTFESAVESQANDSENAIETMPESTTPAKSNSKSKA